ncbi:MAG: putative heme-binding protein [Verrucomicrobiales bacterium]|nr:putative heme-binding protein [Verrucomicrobiales bacterium]
MQTMSVLKFSLLASALLGGTSSLFAAQPKQAEPLPLDASGLPKGVKIPTGFKGTLFAAPPDVGYPTCLAATPSGELFVGVDENGSLDAKPERGRVVRCIDTDGDGKADKFNVFAKMDSPRGVWFENNILYVMHPPLLEAFIDEDGDGVSDRSEVLLKGLGFDLKFRGADHTVNGMRMGIDGFLYIAVGDYGATNAMGKDGAKIQLHGGGVVRIRPDGSGLEIVSRGQRNIYDVAVSPELDLFTRDNTNDGGGWDVRLSHVIMSAYYGYPSMFKNAPDEIIQPLADYGGGSPCGSLFLDEPGFPQGYGHALYTCEWGRSKVYRHPLKATGSTFEAQQESFIDIPRTTDMDVDGQSRLYISSWANGGFNYGGPNVGYVIQVKPEGYKPQPFPNLKEASDTQLLELIKSPSAVARLYTQREILRRGAKGLFTAGLERIAGMQESIPVRVAAIFTLEQLTGPKAQQALVRLTQKPDVREYALRALADNPKDAPSVPVKAFTQALTDPNGRARLQAVIGLGRIGKAEVAPALLPLTADADVVIRHAAVKSLVALHAVDAAMQAFDSPGSSDLAWGAAQVLQAFHEPQVVNGLIERLAKVQDTTMKRAILRSLARLYNREADWDGKWWGTRPDTTGPYFKPVKWESSEQIAEVLRNALNSVDADTLRWFVVTLQKNRVDLPKMTPLVMKLAKQDPGFRAVAVDLLSGRGTLPDESISLFAEVAASDKEEPALRAKAIRALRNSSKKSEALDAVITALSQEKLPGEVNNAWEEFARDIRNGQNVAYFVKLAGAGPAPRQVLAYGVLASLATQKLSSKETKALASAVVDQGWSKPQSAEALLKAVGKLRLDAYAFQVRSLQADTRPQIAKAAKQAAQQMELDKKGAGTGRPLVESMKYEQLLALATKEKGDTKSGAQMFTKAGCVACHTVNSDEAPKGPYLGGIATRYSRIELCESILKPSAKIAQGFETQWIKTKEDDEFEGFVTREGGDDLDLRNIAGITTTIAKKEIKERGKRDTSIMPNGLLDKFTPEDLASLLSYLESLKK